jgi:hypothetical protein
VLAAWQLFAEARRMDKGFFNHPAGFTRARALLRAAIVSITAFRIFSYHGRRV